MQAQADVDYFLAIADRALDAAETQRLRAGTLHAYRWRYILSGAEHPRFGEILTSLVTPEQGQRIGQALAPLAG